MDKKIEKLIQNWRKRNIEAVFCKNREEAVKYILQLVPKTASVGFSGSLTLNELGMVPQLQAQGVKVFNPYQEGLPPGEILELRKLGTRADYYLAAANAISQDGELVFFSAFGNRTAGISFGKGVIILAGINKITENLGEAIKRAREYATPLNCKRLGWNTPCFKDGICRNSICLYPEYKRMCCQILIIEAEATAGRLKVVLIDEKLGF